MGKGLGLSRDSKGTHVAFTAGTGILVLVDLIAKLALGETNVIPLQDRMHPEFKIVLFASFLKRQDAIALELIKTLESVVKMSGSQCFELHLRMSDEVN